MGKLQDNGRIFLFFTVFSGGLQLDGEITGADAVFGFEGPVEIGIILKTAVLEDFTGGDAVGDQFSGGKKPL